MSMKVSAPTAMANGRPTPTPMPAAAPVEIPFSVAGHVEPVASLDVVSEAPALPLVADADAVAVVALSARSVERATFITARYAPTVKFCFEQLSRLVHANTFEAHVRIPA